MSSISQLPHISVCICTFQRPEYLCRTLNALDTQETGDLFTYSVVVVDNDAEASAKNTVSGFTSLGGHPVTFVVEPQKNIACARNAAVLHSLGITSPLSTTMNTRLRIGFSNYSRPVKALMWMASWGRSDPILTALLPLGSRKEHFSKGHRIRQAWYYSGRRHVPGMCCSRGEFCRKTKRRSVLKLGPPEATSTSFGD